MNNQRGYSLIELVVVGALTSVLLVLGATSLRSAMAREEVDGWARSVAYEISAGQQLAITRRASVTASFQNKTFTITGGGTTRQEILPAHITFGSTLQTVTFDRRGTPSAAFTLTVSSTSGRSYLVTVAAGTGRVSINEP